MTPRNDRQSRAVPNYLLLLALMAGVGLLTTLPLTAAAQQAQADIRITDQSIAQARAAGAKATKYATDFNWTLSPSDDLSVAGPKTLHLARCAPGVTGNEPEYWIYISGGGSPEAAQVTGGTCKGDDQPGTLNIVTTAAHPRGYTVSSASSGLQEASIAARWTNQLKPTYTQGGKVIAPPGEFKIFAPVSFLTVNQTVDFSGSMFECWVSGDACMKIGRATSYNSTSNVTLINPRGRPTQLHGQQPMIAVYGQKTRILNLMTMQGVTLGPGKQGTFGSYLRVIGDQAFLLDGLDTTAGWGLECTPEFCGTTIVAPGPFGAPTYAAAVGWIRNAQISMQCMGNGIDWHSGNGLKISDSVIQGYSQFGVRGGNDRGGYGMITMDNIYMEDPGTCPNPLGNLGTAGVLAQGGKFDISGGEGPSGHFPRFTNTGSTHYDYYLVAKREKVGASNLLYAGYAQSNGSGKIMVTTPDVAGATSFDLLRVTPPSGLPQAPNGTGDFAVATNVGRASACANGVCTFEDSQAPPTSYTVPLPSYYPRLDFWPGALILGAGQDSNSSLAASTAHLALPANTLSYQVNVMGMAAPAVFSEQCLAASGSPLWMSCTGAAYPPASMYEQNAMVLAVKPNNDGGLKTNLKGRLNFSTLGGAPSHIITLSDSNFAKTVANGNNRPTNDPKDAYIGYDQNSGGGANLGISIGAPLSISSYIGNVGDGTHWNERLTAHDKAFAVPVVIKSGSTLTVGDGSAISEMKIFKTAVAASSHVPAQRCADIAAEAMGLTTADQVTGVTPPGPLGNLSLNAYPKSADTVTLHFCNASASDVSIPQGSYSFLAVR